MSFHQIDDVARSIDLFGLYDLVVTEAIWRLLRDGDTFVDVGANVGSMTVAAAARLARAGRVVAFEPHPRIFEDLEENVRRARKRFPGVEMVPRREALSDENGKAWLSMPEGFETNRGIARLGGGQSGFEVKTRRLEDLSSEIGPISVLKIDIEGHEATALRGARGLLENRMIRHVVFEEHGSYPTETTSLLLSHGYEIFGLERSLLRARLGDAAAPRRSRWEALSLLATLDSAGADAAFRGLGWRCLAT